MALSLSREQLHELVWSRPVSAIASDFGISDVAFAKMCRKHEIPLPGRGYWARIEAGQEVRKEPLPARGLGMPQVVRPGRPHWQPAPDNLDELEIPPLAEFSETEEDLTRRITKLVGAVTIPRKLERPHPAIARLLEEDEARKAEQAKAGYQSYSNGPLFDTPFERRRLRLLSGLFLAMRRQGVNVFARKKDPDDFEIKVGEEPIIISADCQGAERLGWRSSDPSQRPASTEIIVALKSFRIGGMDKMWKDRPNDPVENHAAEIVVNTLVFGEMQYRNGERHHHEWLVERKKQITEQKKARREAEERAAAEARAKAERARIDRLLGEADAFRRANDIRAYVEAARTANEASATPLPVDQFEKWADQALGTADSIDPVLSRSFLKDIED